MRTKKENKYLTTLLLFFPSSSSSLAFRPFSFKPLLQINNVQPRCLLRHHRRRCPARTHRDDGEFGPRGRRRKKRKKNRMLFFSIQWPAIGKKKKKPSVVREECLVSFCSSTPLTPSLFLQSLNPKTTNSSVPTWSPRRPRTSALSAPVSSDESVF